MSYSLDLELFLRIDSKQTDIVKACELSDISTTAVPLLSNAGFKDAPSFKASNAMPSIRLSFYSQKNYNALYTWL